MENHLVSKKEAAAFFGISTQALDGWFTAGCPVEERSRAGNVGKVSLRAMTQWRIRRAYESKHPVNASLSHGWLREGLGKYFLPAINHRTYRHLGGLLVEGYGMSKADALRLWTEICYLNHCAIEDMFEGDFHVQYSDVCLAIGKAMNAGTLDAWIAKNWPDEPDSKNKKKGQ